MNWIVAVSAGAGLGLAYFGGLWFTVVGVVRQPSQGRLGSGERRRPASSSWALGLAILSRQGAGSVLAALGGTLAVAVVYVAAVRRSSTWKVEGFPRPPFSSRADRGHREPCSTRSSPRAC